MGIDELKARRELVDAFIRVLAGINDPRRDDALAHYRAQVTALDAEITRLEREARGEPEPVIVGLRPAQLFGKAQ